MSNKDSERIYPFIFNEFIKRSHYSFLPASQSVSAIIADSPVFREQNNSIP